MVASLKSQHFCALRVSSGELLVTRFYVRKRPSDRSDPVTPQDVLTLEYFDRAVDSALCAVGKSLLVIKACTREVYARWTGVSKVKVWVGVKSIAWKQL